MIPCSWPCKTLLRQERAINTSLLHLHHLPTCYLSTASTISFWSCTAILIDMSIGDRVGHYTNLDSFRDILYFSSLAALPGCLAILSHSCASLFQNLYLPPTLKISISFFMQRNSSLLSLWGLNSSWGR